MATRIGSMLAGWRRFYGENPMHLLALLGCFALAGYAVSVAVREPMPTPVLLAVWFVGAVIGHDLVLYPLYALADRSLLAGLRARRRLRRARPVAVPATNHIRVPALGSGLLLLVFFPGIVRQGEDAYVAASGLTMAPYLGRWLLITGAMFLLSAALYALRLARARAARTTTDHNNADQESGLPPTATS